MNAYFIVILALTIPLSMIVYTHDRYLVNTLWALFWVNNAFNAAPLCLRKAPKMLQALEGLACIVLVLVCRMNRYTIHWVLSLVLGVCMCMCQHTVIPEHYVITVNGVDWDQHYFHELTAYTHEMECRR